MLTRLLSLWQSIPLSIRKSFYSLPLFIQWWPFIYFEKEKGVLEVLYVALSYFLFFMLGSLFSIILYSSVNFFSGQIRYNLYYTIFVLQFLWGSLYIGLSFLLCYESYTGKKLRFWKLRVHLAQKIVKGIESFFHFS